MIIGKILNQEEAILASAGAANALGASTILVYNVLLRVALGQPLTPAIAYAGKLYAVLSFLLGVGLGFILLRRLQRAALEREATWILAYPLLRAALTTVLWLGSIPALALVAQRVNGRVDPVGFPHFVSSVVVGWLISTAYSSVFHVWLALRLAAPQARLAERLLRAARWLTVAALAVPLVSVGIYLHVFEPWHLGMASKGLERFVVALIVLGSHGVLFTRWAVARMHWEIYGQDSIGSHVSGGVAVE